jgi:hypothetical protein
MRLRGQSKGGFYAAHPDAVAAVLEHLMPAKPGQTTILDPCAGEGCAIVQLAQGLHADPWAIELSEDRAESVRNLLPPGQALTPGDFLTCHVSPLTFSAVWLNPPFDYATGGMGRTELEFLTRALPLLVEEGLLILVCPEDVVSNWGIRQFLADNLYQVWAMPFPKHVRHYTEVVVFGRKRSVPEDTYTGYDYYGELAAGSPRTYALPTGHRPNSFRKLEPTDTEVARMVEASPIRHAFFRELREQQQLRPPMPPGVGHRAMLLASGHIDGLIVPKDGSPPHVIRGTARKEKYISDVGEESDGEGNCITRTTISERVRLVIRTLDSEGHIKTLEDGDGEQRDESDEV